MVKNLSANAGDVGLIPGSRRSHGEENGNLLQYSCLGNPMDRPGGLHPMGLQRVGYDLQQDVLTGKGSNLTGSVISSTKQGSDIYLAGLLEG